MSGFKVNFSVNNQLATPSMHAAALANRPAAGQPGRVFIDTDSPSTGMYRDTGTAWVQIAETGATDTDTLQTVTNRGNVTTQSITVGSATAPVGTFDVRKATAGLNGANDWAIVSNNNPVISSGASFGVNYVNAVYGAQSLTFSGNATIGNTGINSAGNFINTLSNNASGTITVAQGSGTNRAIAGVQAGIYYNTPNAMTFTHVAGIKTLQPINSGAVGASVTNYYGVHVGDSTPSSGTISYTNRWGIYQEGASDPNYFAGNVGIGTTSVNSSLEIYKASGNSYIYLTNGTSGTNNGVVLRFNNIDYMGMIGTFTSGELKVGGFNAGGYFMTFYSNNAERMRLTPSGRLLIGTTTESTYLLDVNGTFRSNNNGYGIVLTSTSRNSIQWIDSGTFRWAIGSQAIQGGELANSFNFYSATSSSTQVSIASDGTVMIGVPYPISSNYAPSAILQAASTTKGFLPPRMTNAQMTAIVSPATGLMVYDLTNSRLNVYDGSNWISLH
jgi:hypothetical protein